MATETLSVRITADIKGFSSSISKMSSDLQRVGKDFEGLNKLGGAMQSVGKKLTLGLTVPIAGIGIASAKTAMDFDAGMREVSAISGATGKDLGKLTDLAKDMGAKTKFSAVESAEALKYMGMAGWKTEDMMSGLPGILDLAAAGGTDLALTSDIVTDGLTGLGMTAEDTGEFVDIMASTCSNANTSIELMGETLKYAGPVAGTLGIEMSDLSLAIGLMGNAGIKGSQAGTALRAGLTNLVKPTKQMSAAMDKYGVELKKNDDGSVDFMGTITNLRDKLGKLSETEEASALASIFGKESMSGWAAIVNASEGDFNKLKSAIDNSNGSAKNMSEIMMGGAKGAITEMKSALEGVAITIGERLTPVIENVADWISKMAGKFQDLNPATQDFILIVGGILAVLGPLLMIGGTLVKGFATMKLAAIVLGTTVGGLAAPFLIAIGVIGAIIGIGILLCQNWDKIKAFAKNLAKSVGDAWNDMVKWIQDAGNSISDVAKGMWESVKGAWDNLVNSTKEAWDNMINYVSDVIQSVSDFVSNGFKSIADFISNTWNSIVDFTSQAWEFIKNLVKVGIMFIAEIISFGVELILLPWTFLWENCKEFIIPIWEGIKTYISEKLTEVSEFIRTTLEAIANFFSEKFEIAKNFVIEKFDLISTTISEFMNSVREFLREVLDTIALFFQEKFEQAKNFVIEKFTLIKTTISDFMKAASDFVSSTLDSIKNFFSEKLEQAKAYVSEKFNAIKDYMSNKMNEAKSLVGTAIEWIKNKFNVFQSAYNTVNNIFSNIKNSITDKINGAKNAVKDGIDKMKSFFNFSWSLPKLKMPHISVSGGFSIMPPKAPSFSIAWYSKGAIFKRPTVMGGIGVGDRNNSIGNGAEAILPIRELPKLLGLDKQSTGVNLNIENFNNYSDSDVEELMDKITFELKKRKIGGAF